MNNKNIPQEGVHNQLIQGTTVKGEIYTEGNIKIDGKLIGTLETLGRVVIGETGEIDGEIKCGNAQISGKMKGKITCSELLSLKSTVCFTGDIITSKLSIESGAKFSGSCSMPAEISMNSTKNSQGKVEENSDVNNKK